MKNADSMLVEEAMHPTSTAMPVPTPRKAQKNHKKRVIEDISDSEREAEVLDTNKYSIKIKEKLRDMESEVDDARERTMHSAHSLHGILVERHKNHPAPRGDSRC